MSPTARNKVQDPSFGPSITSRTERSDANHTLITSNKIAVAYVTAIQTNTSSMGR